MTATLERKRRQRKDTQQPHDIVSCASCGKTQRRDAFPKMNVQFGKQYYRRQCAQCTVIQQKTYKKDPSRSAEACRAKGLKPPGRPKVSEKQCPDCKFVFPRSAFEQPSGRLRSRCLPCFRTYKRKDAVAFRQRRKLRPKKVGVDFSNMMAAFRSVREEA